MSQEKDYPFYISEYVNSITYELYFNETFGEPKSYSKLFDMLRHLSENDIVKMYVNSFGGNMFTGVQLINAMQASPAHIITILDGAAMSLAPLILFAGDSIEITEQSIIMFHDYSSPNGGKGSEQLTSATAMNHFYKDMLMKYARPFLTEEEIEPIVRGQDCYFNSEQIAERLLAIHEEMEDEDEDEDEIIFESDNAVKLTDDMVEEFTEEDRQMELELVEFED